MFYSGQWSWWWWWWWVAVCGQQQRLWSSWGNWDSVIKHIFISPTIFLQNIFVGWMWDSATHAMMIKVLNCEWSAEMFLPCIFSSSQLKKNWLKMLMCASRSVYQWLGSSSTPSCSISSTASSWAVTSINKSILQLMLHVQPKWLSVHLYSTPAHFTWPNVKLVLGNFLSSIHLSLSLSHSHQAGAELRNLHSVQPQQILDPAQLLQFQTRNVKWVSEFFSDFNSHKHEFRNHPRCINISE